MAPARPPPSKSARGSRLRIRAMSRSRHALERPTPRRSGNGWGFNCKRRSFPRSSPSWRRFACSAASSGAGRKRLKSSRWCNWARSGKPAWAASPGAETAAGAGLRAGGRSGFSVSRRAHHGPRPQARRQLWDLIEQFKLAGRTILMTTHYMTEAERLCDRVAIMDHGKAIAAGTPRELIASHSGGADGGVLRPAARRGRWMFPRCGGSRVCARSARRTAACGCR